MIHYICDTVPIRQMSRRRLIRWQQVAGERAGGVGVQTLGPQGSSEDVLTGLTWGFKAVGD